MDNLKKIAISIGDLNGIGVEIALKCHDEISKICQPIYCINSKMLSQASKLLKLDIPEGFKLFETKGEFEIKPGSVSKKSGKYSYNSFLDAINLANKKKVDAICTLPINKEAWNKADIRYKGHTEVLRDYFGKHAIMMLGCEKMFVALFTEHIALKKVAKKINDNDLTNFLIDFYKNVKSENIGVLGLNPHASDNGVLGDEEIEIFKAIKKANKYFGKNIFKGPLVPDTAFSPLSRKNFNYFVAMYHDQGLAPLKALYFDESINVSLNLPIIRTSVDHGTAFNIAYKNENINTQSYLNAIKEAINLSNK
ncbi:4-hydroxythreonine-4-phosphate dehydrogenase [Aliarcobacter cibarius]|jgi:4-phospho-D-threonate 3-dehydrogenase / 4-phospho-D-erythronate 3-dehydrogenase|uniref:4-hydroxythreonine-4-phosphate dehydrogenase n=1 Tax=Aliarcobacter cibarius TaxID=255507 RepID=A0A5J6RL06_9BACT|nr:4-hydroxythreonine-4-phosphate dehydrogenase [Aliarcobacter cibarius]QEZ89558.1 4-hydroxy-L-threonine phosphate dehydrogenase, NAD-dependent [Aliarcobacter cibarius]QKJ27558.1 4-hydroxy-L-threonine phosphate dehydrogenase, NAD-dependent [Aliarcobacter cibarius]TLT03965.1 4-hydroxythreonine-4-phosphate dehydrogenase [Aliarcobacter cibarius]